MQMTRALEHLARCLLSLTAAGCTVAPPDFSSKTCPCAPGFSCDVARNVCIEGALGDGAIANAALSVASLHAAWATPHQIRWEWDAAGDESRFLRFELVTATSQSDAQQRTGTAHVWLPAENPELATFQLPHTGSQELVRGTITDQHAPFVEYFAELSVIDTEQHRSVSNVASLRTTVEPLGELTLYSDDLASGEYLTPPAAVVSTAGPFSGSSSIEFANACTGMAVCFEQLGPSDLSPDVTQMRAGDFSTAFVEFALQHDSATASFWSQVRLGINATPTLHYYGYFALTLRPGAYRLYQIPLRTLQPFTAGVPLAYDELQKGLKQVTVGGNWGSGAVVRLDEVRVRW